MADGDNTAFDELMAQMGVRRMEQGPRSARKKARKGASKAARPSGAGARKVAAGRGGAAAPVAATKPSAHASPEQTVAAPPLPAQASTGAAAPIRDARGARPARPGRRCRAPMRGVDGASPRWAASVVMGSAERARAGRGRVASSRKFGRARFNPAACPVPRVGFSPRSAPRRGLMTRIGRRAKISVSIEE